MPFYEYECSKCRYYVEVLQKLSDAPLRKCPSCGKKALRKLVSAPVFRLKGSGWYETDFKSDQEGRRNLAGADKDAPAAPAEPKEAGKSEAAEGATSTAAAGAAEAAKTPASQAPAAPASEGGRNSAPATSHRKSAPAARSGARAKSAAKRAATKSPPRKRKRRGAR
jgi:putative FmdB family regulatory protein